MSIKNIAKTHKVRLGAGLEARIRTFRAWRRISFNAAVVQALELMLSSPARQTCDAPVVSSTPTDELELRLLRIETALGLDGKEVAP